MNHKCLDYQHRNLSCQTLQKHPENYPKNSYFEFPLLLSMKPIHPIYEQHLPQNEMLVLIFDRNKLHNGNQFPLKEKILFLHYEGVRNFLNLVFQHYLYSCNSSIDYKSNQNHLIHQNIEKILELICPMHFALRHLN